MELGAYAQSEKIAGSRFIVAAGNIVTCPQQVVGGISTFFQALLLYVVSVSRPTSPILD